VVDGGFYLVCVGEDVFLIKINKNKN